jgi:hypothetical protein
VLFKSKRLPADYIHSSRLFVSVRPQMDLNKLSSHMFATVIFNVCMYVCIYISINLRSRESAVGIATVYGLDDRGFGVWVSVGEWIFTSSRRPNRLWDPPILLSNGYLGVLPPEVKRPGREADHSPTTSAYVKKTWIYISTPPYVFMA